MTKQLIGVCGRCRQMTPLASIRPSRCKRCASSYLPENQRFEYLNAVSMFAGLGVTVILAYLLADWILSR